VTLAGPSVKLTLLTVNPIKTSNYTVDFSLEGYVNPINIVLGRTIAGVDTIILNTISNQPNFYTEIVAFTVGTPVIYYLENFGSPTADFNYRISIFG
jgi:hypothetical protein